MEEHNRKFRAAKTSPLRALHQNNIIWKRKRTSQDNGEFTLKRFKHCSPINEETMMELDGIEGKREGKITCIFCRQWSGGLEDFAWHVSQAHGIPAHVGKCLVNKLMVSRELGGEKFMNAHYKCIPQFVLDHQQDLSDCE